MSKSIWIDAGHGGGDSGAVGPGNRFEKADNLRFALALREAFARQGCQVVMTRTGDVALSLDDRTRLERDKGCNLAISCHRNAAATATPRGLEIWLHNAAPQSYKDWAIAIAKGMEAMGLPLRNGNIPQKVAPGVFRGYRDGIEHNYHVNQYTGSPSMLIELGFISNSADNAFFDANLETLAEVVTKASCAFLGLAYKAPAVPPSEPATDYRAKYEHLRGELEALVSKYPA